MSACLHRFHEKAPNVEVRFQTGEDYADLFGGETDMAIRFSPDPGAEYQFQYLHQGHLIPVCTAEFARRHKLSPDTRDLTGVTLFRILDKTRDPTWIGWQEILKKHGIRKDDMDTAQNLTGKGTALSGAGLMLMGLTECYNGLADGRLVAPLGPDFVRPLSYGYRLVWPAGRTMTRPMRFSRLVACRTGPVFANGVRHPGD